MIRNTKNLKGKRILIYGGSFDPVHKGHIHLLKLAIKKTAKVLRQISFFP